MLTPYLITLGAMSVITMMLYGVDKARAADGRGRIPEITLLTFTALGGGVGAAIGRLIFHHKINLKTKFHFTATVWASILLQAAGAVALWLF